MISETFSPGYVLLVQGEGIKIIPEMMHSFRFDHVFFTGSIPVAKAIYKMAAEKLIPVTLELGGKSPGIVEADADIQVAARRLVLGKFINTGQTCIAPDYILVHASVKEELIKHFIQSIEKFYGKHSGSSGEYGKIINEKRFDKLISYLPYGKILYGGRYDRETLWIEPTLLEMVPPDSPPMTEEIFGPVLPVLTFTSREEAMAIVQSHPHPLAFYLFTASRTSEKYWVENVQFGGGCINNTAWYFANKEFPFGGVGNSGLGAYHGKYSFDSFTREKAVMKTPTWFDPAIKYPPLKGKMNILKWFIK
jgi:aldehyde dehydrogenase (NAD+)